MPSQNMIFLLVGEGGCGCGVDDSSGRYAFFRIKNALLLNFAVIGQLLLIKMCICDVIKIMSCNRFQTELSVI